MTGSIRMTQAAMGMKITIDTNLQFETPSKLYLNQVKSEPNPRRWLVTSDGKHFSYNLPNSQRDSVLHENNPNERLVEAVSGGTVQQSVQDIYKATANSIGDRSPVLDVAISSIEDLRFLKNQWATISYGGREKIGEEDCYVIKGKWREYGDAQPSGEYAMFVTDEFAFRRFALRVTLSVSDSNGRSTGPTELTTVWDANLKVNGAVDPALFKVILR